MSDNKQSVSYDSSFLALALLIVAFWGEPDLVDALIHYLMGG